MSPLLLALLAPFVHAQSPAQQGPPFNNLAYCSTANIPPADLSRCSANLGPVNNLDPAQCDDIVPLWPCDGEEGHWDATMLIVPAGFTVTHVTYRLYNGDNYHGVECDATVPHKVALYVVDALPPPPNPTVIEEWVMSGSSTAGEVLMEAALTVPYVTNPGDTLLVSVEFAGDVDPDPIDCAENGPIICQNTCRDLNLLQSSWWSNATTPPYSWQGLRAFGIRDVPLVGVRGY